MNHSATNDSPTDPTATFVHFRSLALDENVGAMGVMLDRGFDVNTRNESRQTVFMHCCANNRLRSAKFLAGRGAEVNLADSGGGTAMDFAVNSASRNFVEWLTGIGGKAGGATHYSDSPPHP